MVHAGMQVGGNVIISNFVYIMHSSFSGTEMTLDGFAFATLSGLIAGFTFGKSTLSGMLIGLGIELAGYYQEFFEKIKKYFLGILARNWVNLS